MSATAIETNANNSASAMAVMGENERPMFCSFNPTSKEDKVKLFKALTQSDKKLSDCINAVIPMKDVMVQMISITNKDTGEVSDAPRIVLFDKDGTSYSCVSWGIYNSLKTIMRVFGEPTWDEPMNFKVTQVTNGNRKMLSLEIV